ncbi:MAG: hypothetical protein Q7T07_18055 [Burkholderiaceae bacterium]|nr:hypothetical protein [Burkholderiaceae bacterium]
MLTHILQKTPIWVWALLAGLIALGYSQTRTRVVGLQRTVLMPVAMMLLSLYGTLSAFGLSATTLAPWLTACAGMAGLILLRPVPDSTRYDCASKRYALPGSWLPMGVILAIFLTKYAVGVTLSMQPGLARDPIFVLVVSLLYGLFSGFFAGRALRLWRLALV